MATKDVEQQSTSWKPEDEETDERRKSEENVAKNIESMNLEDEDNRGIKNGKENFSESERNDSEDELDNSALFNVPKRYILAIMMFAGFMNMYAIRVNLNVAIGAMVKPHPVVENGRHYIKVILMLLSDKID